MPSRSEHERLAPVHSSPGGGQEPEQDELAQLEREIGLPLDDGASTTSSQPLRSQYTLTRPELLQALANRFVHSRTYIILYLSLACLSLTTVVLSLIEGCPGVAFYVLEVVINVSMIAETGVRLVAFGRKFWKSPFNYLDLLITLFCLVTLLLIFLSHSRCTPSSPSSSTSTEELLDTLLLVFRNILQFTRLANVLRKSGRSIFARPTPIDLSQARRAGYVLDIDLYDEDARLAAEDEEGAAPMLPQRAADRRAGQNGARPNGVVFDAAAESTVTAQGQDRMGAPDRTKVFGTDDVEEQWAHL